MGIIAFIIIGGIIGFVASRLMGRHEGMLMSVVIGIVGSFIGSFIGQLFNSGNTSYASFTWAGVLWSLIGAVILVAIMNAVSRPHHHAV